MDEPTKRVLIVDDEPEIRGMLKRAVERQLKLHVDVAASGLEALEEIRKHTYDLLVTDLNMPEMDGKTLFTAVKEHHPEIEVIVLTANPSMDSTMAAVKSHVHSFLTKPIRMQAFLDTVKAALEAGDRKSKADGTGDEDKTQSVTQILNDVQEAASRLSAELEKLAGSAPASTLMNLHTDASVVKDGIRRIRSLIQQG